MTKAPMPAPSTPHRAYRAPCPGCGAPVEFRSAQSTHAVCAYCRSTVVRDGDVLTRVGKMAELFDDHSPLQLNTTGQWQGNGFTLVGRLQYRTGAGTWTEWEAVLDDGRRASLAEDNGAYVFSLPATTQRELPAPDRFRVGATTAIAGKPFSVTSNDMASLVSAQGELPRLPPAGAPFVVVELRSADGEVLGIDYGAQPPALSRGRAVMLEELKLSGLREDMVKEERGRQFACPNCGAPVEVTLANSKSITCRSCNSLIDLSSGTGAQLRHAIQDEPVQPLIPLGKAGTLMLGTSTPEPWQVVGYVERCEVDVAPGDEQVAWREYLLYHREAGFSFLVDAEDGWSFATPAAMPEESPSAAQIADSQATVVFAMWLGWAALGGRSRRARAR